MSKIMQQGHGEERNVAKSKPTLNLVSKTEASSSIVLSPNASNRPKILRALRQKGLILQESTEKPPSRDSNQRRVLKCGKKIQRGTEYEETRCNRNAPESLEFSRKFREYEETRGAHGGKLRIH